MRKVRENIIPSFGNQSLYTAGQPVYRDPIKPGAGYTINVKPGQWVIYDPKTNLALANTITPTSNSEIVVAVGRDLTGNGASDVLLKPFGDKIKANNVRAVRKETSACGTPAIKDVLIRCTECDVPVGFTIAAFNHKTDDQYPFNVPMEYTYTSSVPCTECEGEVSTYKPEKVICNVIDQINGKTNPGLKAFFNHRNGEIDAPFYATRLWANSYDFCLATEASSTCVECDVMTEKVKGISIDGDVTAFDPVIYETAGTPIAAYHRMIDEINVILDGKGWAVPIESVGGCCDLRLQINSCENLVKLVDDLDALIEPCATSTPLAPITRDVDCKTCDDTPGSDTYIGMRIIQKSPELKYDCKYPANPYIGWLSGTIDVYGKGFSSGGFRTVEIQAATPPENLGYTWQQREYKQDQGGSGREFEAYNDYVGDKMLPSAASRMSSTLVNPAKNYTSYSVEHSLDSAHTGVSDPIRMARGRTIFLVPTGESAGFDTFVTNWFGALTNADVDLT